MLTVVFVLVPAKYRLHVKADDTKLSSGSENIFPIETAKTFASAANNGTVNSLTHLNSITSTVQSLYNIRADSRVTHELFTMKLNSSKPQQSGTFVIEHQKEKSAILRRKIVIPYTDVLGLQMDDRKIILDTYKRPQTKKKDESGRQNLTTWSECCEGSDTSGSSDNVRLRNSISPAKQNRECFNSVRHLSSDGS